MRKGCNIVMKKREKPPSNKKAPGFISIYFSSFFLILIAAVFILPTDDTNTLITPDWFYGFLIYTPLLVAILFKLVSVFSKKDGGLIDKSRGPLVNKRGLRPNTGLRIPRYKKAQEQLAAQILDEIDVNVSLANEIDHIGLFVEYYDAALAGFETLSKLDKVKFKGSPQYDLFRLRDEIQWHMCDAIQRHKDRVISEIKGKYRNSREFQERAFNGFKDEINDLRNRFSAQTNNFADESLHEIESILGISHSQALMPSLADIASTRISEIDNMDGHAFEYWCAELLRKNGFINVEVTKGSGDQGVDIVAVKDSIRYAIQCKCYSSNLGNGPVQEVNAGKSLYHCQLGVVMTNQYFTAGAKELADANGVLLWDRDKLEEMLGQA